MGKRTSSCEFYIFISITASIGWLGVQLRSLPLLVVAIILLTIGILVAISDFSSNQEKSKSTRRRRITPKYDSGLELQ